MYFEKINLSTNKPDKIGKKLERQGDVIGSFVKSAKKILQILNNQLGAIGGGDNSSDNRRKRGQERREFLKLMGKITIGVVTGGAGAKFISDILEGEGVINKNYGAGLSDWEFGEFFSGGESEIGNKSAEESVDQGIIREQEDVNYQELKKILLLQYLTTGKINITEIKKSVKNYWLQEYDKKGSQHWGLNKALGRMTEWHNEVKTVFQNVFARDGLQCPEWLIYLGIAESHWTTERGKRGTSWAGAAGVFQLMPETARWTGLRVDEHIDERYNVIANAFGAAEYLARLYKITAGKMNINEVPMDWNSDIWKLVLAFYNGGYTYVGNFFKWAKNNQLEINYNNYLLFRQKNLQSFLDNRLKAKTVIYTVKAGDNLSKIAKRYKGVAVQQIKKDNNLSRNTIYPNQQLRIRLPEKSIEEKQVLLERMFAYPGELSGSLENLNYPEKFIGILEAIRKNDLFIESGEDNKEHPFGDYDGNTPLLGGLSKRKPRRIK